MSFYKVYSCFAILAFISFGLPPIALILTIFTFGLFGFVISIWMYMTALIPAVWLKQYGYSKFCYIPVAIICLVSLAMIPPIWAERKAFELKQSVEANDLYNPLPKDFNSFTLVEDTNKTWYQRKKESVHYALCNALCQRLLVLNLVDSLTIKTSVKKYGQDKEDEIITYELIETDYNCPHLYVPLRHNHFLELDMTKKEIAKGKCIVGRVQAEVPNGLIIEYDKAKFSFFPKFDLAYIKDLSRLTVSNKKDDEIVKLITKSSYEVNKATAPILITPYASMLYSQGGVKFVSKTEKYGFHILENFIINDLNLNFLPDKSITKKAGYKRRQRNLNLHEYNNGLYVPKAEEINIVLSKVGNNNFSPMTHSLIDNWIKSFHVPEKSRIIDSFELKTLSKVIDDNRYNSIRILSNMLKVRPALAIELKKKISDRIARGSCQKSTYCYRLENILQNAT